MSLFLSAWCGVFDAEPKNLHELGYMYETVAKKFRFLYKDNGLTLVKTPFSTTGKIGANDC